MAVLGLLLRLTELFSLTDAKSEQRSDLESGSQDSPQSDDLRQLTEMLSESDQLPEHSRRAAELLTELLDQSNRDLQHWNRVRDLVNQNQPDPELTPSEEFRQTERLAKALRDAHEVDYKYYARGHRLALDLREQMNSGGETENYSEEVLITMFASLFDFSITQFWKASIRYNGLRMMFLNPDDELGNLALEFEMKRTISDILLSTTTVVETVGQSILKNHREDVSSNQSLNNVIEMLASDGLISEEERETLHNLREMRNKIAHHMIERTTFEWVDDFGKLAVDCFSAIEAVEYPLQERIEDELHPDVGKEISKTIVAANDETNIDWQSILQDYSKGSRSQGGF